MPLNPELAEVIETALKWSSLDLHTCMPGQVMKYDAATQRAEVLPVIRQIEYDDETGRRGFELPVLPNVPVLWPRGGGYSFHFPLKEGDLVMLIFNECDVSMWRYNAKSVRDPTTGTMQVKRFDPCDLTRHSLSHPVALAGVYPDQNPIEDAPEDHAVVIVPDGGKLRISKPNASHVEPVALAEKVAAQFSALKEAISNAAPVANDGGAALKTAIMAALADWPASVASTTLEAEGES
jgi:hypothetical protein